MDPWTAENTISQPNKSETNIAEHNFENNFSPFISLDDSDRYLSSLYSRLSALKRCSGSADLVSAAERLRHDHMIQLLASSSSHEETEHDSVYPRAGKVKRYLTPQSVAVNASELTRLLSADSLQQTHVRMGDSAELTDHNSH